MPRPAFPGLALALGTIWLLAGALYKLFEGSVTDVPQSVLGMSPLGAFDTFRFAIAAELAVVALVISLPRLGWIALVGVFGTFIAVLWPLVAEGAASCGCFGGTVTIPPQTMMIIDGGLLLLILISRPWRMHKASGLGPLAAIPLLAAAVAGPILKLPTPEKVQPRIPVTRQDRTTAGVDIHGESGAASEGIEADMTENVTIDEPDAVVGDPGTPTTVDQNQGDTAQGDTAPVDPAPIGEPDPAPEAPGLPSFLQVDFAAMEGQDITVQDFYQIADQTQGFIDANSHVVVYRESCEVCEEHLKTLAAELLNGDPKWQGKTMVLMRVMDDLDLPKKVTILPEPSQKVSLPTLERGYLVTTPVSFDVDDAFIIRNVVDVKKELGH